MFTTRILCPLCFSYFTRCQVPFRCGICPPEPDEVFQKVWVGASAGRAVAMGKVLPAQFGQKGEALCSDCGHLTRKQICPECHGDLPPDIGSNKNYIFSIIGAKNTGKSHYLGVLPEVFTETVGPRVHLLLEPKDEATLTRYKRDFYDPIFNRKETIRGNASFAGDWKSRFPLIYDLFPTGDFDARGVKKRNVTLVFFDTAGEDLRSEDIMDRLNRYIYRSNGIILLLDPLQIPEVRKALRAKFGGDIGLPELEDETRTIVTRVKHLIQNGLGIRRKKSRIKIPLALAFSKFDAIEPLLEGAYTLTQEANHENGFDRSDFQAMNDEMRALLIDWNQRNLLQNVEASFKHFAFFGLSSLGCNPHGTNEIPMVHPRRVEDPFLWLLYHHKLIRGYHS